MGHDEELLVRSQSDPHAFEAVVVTHSNSIYAFLYRRVPKLADDLLAEVWVAAFSARSKFDPAQGSARGWLYGIARYVLLAHYRARIPEPAGIGDDCADRDHWERVDERIDAASAAKPLIRAVGELPAEEREVLLLVAWDQLRIVDAATVLGIPAGTARSRLHRARARMKIALNSLVEVDRGDVVVAKGVN